MVADAWKANASKGERIKLLAAALPSMHLKHLLDDKMVELNNVESRLVSTQQLVERLNDQLADAKKEQSAIETDNRKLECQLGEAKVRLDHDYEDEERLKAELDEARADVEEYKQSADHWRHIAVAELDKHAPEVIRIDDGSDTSDTPGEARSGGLSNEGFDGSQSVVGSPSK
jgi:chromosome segregation ATPase